MQTVALVRGTAQRITRAGCGLRVINHPSVDPSRQAADGNAFLAEWLLVGFDHVPSIAAYEAVIPPYTDATIRVPDDVRAVYLLAPGPEAPTANWTTVFTLNATVPALVDWFDGAVVPALRSLDVVGLRASGAGVQTNEGFVDGHGGFWAPSRWTTVLDQELNDFGYKPHLRPALAPSLPVAIHAVTAANTLTAFTGVAAPAAGVHPQSAGKVLKRLYISCSVAGLIVVGTNNLAVASPDTHEVARFAPAAAGILPPIDLGEGLELNWDGSVGTWQFYTSVIMTLDMIAILG